MNSFINYILESGLSLGALALIYYVFLRNETFFKANRLFLLFAVIFSSLLPLFRFKVLGSSRAGNELLASAGTTNMLETITVSSSGFSNSLVNWISTSQLLVYAYVLGASLVGLIVLVRLAQLAYVIKKGQLVAKNGINYVYIDENSSPYSFLNYLFVSRNLEKQPGWEKMLAHESEHIRQGHTVDILILELISIFQWFNPFFWLLRRVIKENHEYMADRAVLNQGVAVNHYKAILVTQFIGNQFSIANNFNSSLIKSRLKMMTKIKSSNQAKWRYLLGVLMACALVLVFACENKDENFAGGETTPEGVQIKSETGEQPLYLIDGEMADSETMGKLDPNSILSIIVNKEVNNPYVEKYGALAKNGVVDITLKSGALDSKNTAVNEVVVVGYAGHIAGADDPNVFNIVEEMPEFPGGELEMRKFIAQRVKYPVIAQDNGIQGKVYVTFVVEKDGSVGRIKIARGVDPSLDAEAMRVVNEMPAWTPGKQRGVNVAVAYTVPIEFVLQ
jgi:TonB family protein